MSNSWILSLLMGIAAAMGLGIMAWWAWRQVRGRSRRRYYRERERLRREYWGWE